MQLCCILQSLGITKATQREQKYLNNIHGSNERVLYPHAPGAVYLIASKDAIRSFPVDIDSKTNCTV